MKLRIIFVLLCSLLTFNSSSIYAMPERLDGGVPSLPTQCFPVNFTFDKHQLVLAHNEANRKNIHIFLIQNASESHIWLERVNEAGSAKAGWGSKLEAGKWSALSLTGGPFTLNCVRTGSGRQFAVPCSDHLSVCEMNTHQLRKRRRSTRWLSENHDLRKVLSSLSRRHYHHAFV